MKFRKVLLVLLSCMLFLMAGCGTVPKASPVLDAKLKLFIAPEENLAGVYIYRAYTLGGIYHITNIFANGKLVGANWDSRYIYIELPPGEHKITAHNEIYKSYTHLVLRVEAGKLYFVQDFLQLGNFDTEIELFLVDDATGKEHVLKYSLAPLF